MSRIYRWMFHNFYSLKALWLTIGGQSFKKRSIHKMLGKVDYMLKDMLKDKNIFNGHELT